MYKDVIWDFDGTLFDTYPGMVYAFKLALKDEGKEETEEEILKYMKISFSDAVEHFKRVYEIGNEFVENMKRYDKEIGLQKIYPFPYAKEVCRRIVGNGGRNFILTHRGNSTYKILERYEMESYFTEVLTKHSGFKRKPDPEGYLYLVNKYGMEKENTIIVGDREIEIAAARAAGVKACLYNTNKVSYEIKPDHVINSLSEFIEICKI